MKLNNSGKTYNQVFNELQDYINNSRYIEKLYVSTLPTEENFNTEVSGYLVILFKDMSVQERCFEKNGEISDEVYKCDEIFCEFFTPENEPEAFLYDDDFCSRYKMVCTIVSNYKAFKSMAPIEFMTKER
jgi:hypothetical protein